MDWVKLYPRMASSDRHYLKGLSENPMESERTTNRLAEEHALCIVNRRDQYTFLRGVYDKVRTALRACPTHSLAKDMYALLCALSVGNYGEGEIACVRTHVIGAIDYIAYRYRGSFASDVLFNVFLHFIELDNDTELLGYLYPKKDNTQVQEPTTNVQLEDTMNSSTTGTNNAVSLSATAAIKIESKLFVNGDDTAKMTDAHIIGIIAETEGHIRNLEAIENKGAKIKAKIEELKAGVAALNKLIDER